MSKVIAKHFPDTEFAKAINCPSDQFVFLERHRPADFNLPYHSHASIEINYLHDCDMTYSFSGTEVIVKAKQFCVFWAAYPHRAVRVGGDGWITNAYVSLTEFLRWQIPSDLANQLLSGAVLTTQPGLDHDRILAERWSNEIDLTSPEWQRLHVMEIQCRLNRMAVEGYDVLLQPDKLPPKKMIGGKAVEQFDRMLRFITQNFRERVTIEDVANAGGITPNYAMSIFKRVLGATIKEHITDVRIFHAKMLLTETDDKILTIALDCGFGSLSTFYETFQAKIGSSPASFRKARNISKRET